MSLRQFDRYETLRVLGEGAMGTVYEALDPRLQRRVAIKTLKAEIVERDPAFLARFQREARTVAALNHPGIVAIYDCDDDYLVMEFIEGRELKAMMGQGPQPTERIAGLLAQLAVALDFAHDHAIIHRDIKPANILVTADGRAKITDFGIAKMEGGSGISGLTHTGQVLGTPAYMSPEQVAGKPMDRRSDQFSLAVVIYQLLTGEPPFTGDSIATLVYKIVAERHRPARELNAALPAGIDAVMDRALAKTPAQRFANCGEFSRAFSTAVAVQAASGKIPVAGSDQSVTVPLAAGAPAPKPRAAPAARPVRPAARPERAQPPVGVAPAPAIQSPAPVIRDEKKNRSALLGRFLLALVLLGAGSLGALHWWRHRGAGSPGALPAQSTPVAAIAAPPALQPELRSAAVERGSPESAPAPSGPGEAIPPPPARKGEASPRVFASAPAPAPSAVRPPAHPAALKTPAPEPATPAAAIHYQAREFKLRKRPGEPVSLCGIPAGFMVADSDQRKLLIFADDGQLTATLPRGDSAGGFRLFHRRRKETENSSSPEALLYTALHRPVAAAVSDEKLFVLEQTLRALLIFDDTGQELARAGGFGDPRLVAARPGEALVWDKDNDSVIAVDAAGNRHRVIAEAHNLQALAYAGNRALAGNSDGLWLETGGQFAPLLNEGDARIASAAAIVPFKGGFAVADPDQRKIHLLNGSLKLTGVIDLKPLGVDSPRLLLARGDSLWVLHEHTKMTVLSPSP